VTAFSIRLKVGAFLLITALGVTYVAVRYVDVGNLIGSGSYAVYADFETGGGIFSNASVTYRGYPVGEVGEVALRDDGVRVQLIIDSDTLIATDVRAVVTPRSAVGEQYVDLRPDRETSAHLRPGDVIGRGRTSGPLPLETLLVNIDQLITSLDTDDVAVVLDELGRAFQGNELALRTLLDASSLLVDEALAHADDAIALIRDGRIALATQADTASAIREWARSLAQLAGTIRDADPDLRGLLAHGPPAATQLTGLLQDLDPSVGTLLGNLITVNGVAVNRLAGIRHMLVLYPVAIEVGYTIMGGDGTGHMGWVAQVTPPTCPYQNGRLACPPGSGIRSASPPAPAGPARVDAATGRIVTADGLPLYFGDTGGQNHIAGAQSWKALLISGVMA
jgi:phospholipid/cholesterol/gamma-HCH transport system substrate-binding protein